MNNTGATDFCTHCRRETSYTWQKRDIVQAIKGVDYPFTITVAICDECGSEMSIPGSVDRIVREIEEQYINYGV